MINNLCVMVWIIKKKKKFKKSNETFLKNNYNYNKSPKAKRKKIRG